MPGLHRRRRPLRWPARRVELDGLPTTMRWTPDQYQIVSHLYAAKRRD
jgi:hypothetical protein